MAKGRRALRYSSEADMPDSMRKLLRNFAEPPATVAAAAAAARQPRHETGVMNKTEARYAQHLEVLKRDGKVRWYGFEAIKLRLANRTWLNVDFMVQLEDGTFELHEVKGRKGNRYYATEDGKLKAKIAAEMYPVWPFLIVWPAKGGGWDAEVLPARTAR